MMKEMKLSIVDANYYFVRAVFSYSGFLLPYCRESSARLI